MTTYEHSFATRTTKQTDYAVLKLVNGEEIIAKVVTSSTNDITLIDPVQIHRITSPIGNEMIRCSYWLLFNTCNEVTVQKNHVVFTAFAVAKERSMAKIVSIVANISSGLTSSVSFPETQFVKCINSST